MRLTLTILWRGKIASTGSYFLNLTCFRLKFSYKTLDRGRIPTTRWVSFYFHVISIWNFNFIFYLFQVHRENGCLALQFPKLFSNDISYSIQGRVLFISVCSHDLITNVEDEPQHVTGCREYPVTQIRRGSYDKALLFCPWWNINSVKTDPSLVYKMSYWSVSKAFRYQMCFKLKYLF